MKENNITTELVASPPAPNAAKPAEEAVEAFFRAQKVPGRRKPFLRQFRRILDGLLCELGGAPLEQATPAMVRRAIGRYQHPRLRPDFARAHLQEFFRWSRAHGYLPRHLCTVADQVALDPGERRKLARPEIEKLLSLIPDAEARMHMILALMTGIRVGDLVRGRLVRIGVLPMGA